MTRSSNWGHVATDERSAVASLRLVLVMAAALALALAFAAPAGAVKLKTGDLVVADLTADLTGFDRGAIV